MPAAHAKLSPSAAARWLVCPGSVYAEPAAPDTGSAASDEGTACHYVAQMCLEKGWEPESFIGETIQAEEKQRPVVFTVEHAAWVRECVDWVRDYLSSHPGAVLYTEQQIDSGLAFGLPVDPETGKTVLWGTCDCCIVSGDELLVLDFKFGFQFVSVHTPQLKVYAVGFMHRHAELSFDRVRLVILQPRAGEPQDPAVLTAAELAAWRQENQPAVERALDPNAPRVPHEKACAWCKAAPLCRELRAVSMRLAQEEFAMPENLSVETVAEVLEKADLIRAHLKACETFAQRTLASGGKLPGYKLVAGKRNRVWSDIASAQATLEMLGIGPDRYLDVPEMCSPAQAEKLVGNKGKALLAPFIEQPEGAPKLAPESDPRPAVAACEFEAVEDEAA